MITHVLRFPKIKRKAFCSRFIVSVSNISKLISCTKLQEEPFSFPPPKIQTGICQQKVGLYRKEGNRTISTAHFILASLLRLFLGEFKIGTLVNGLLKKVVGAFTADWLLESIFGFAI